MEPKDGHNSSILAPSYPNSENVHILWIHRAPDLSLWTHCFPNLFPCVWHVSHLWIDWLRWEDVTCFTPMNWLVAMGRPFSSIWKLFGTMSMPCVVPEMLWSLDELKRVLISEFPILETEEGEGFNILFDLFVEWAEILLNYNNQHPLALLNLGNCGPESFSQGISGRAYSCRIALEGCHRTTEDPIALHTPTHRSSYSTKGIVHQKNLRRQPKTFFFEKLTWRAFFIFFPLRR